MKTQKQITSLLPVLILILSACSPAIPTNPVTIESSTEIYNESTITSNPEVQATESVVLDSTISPVKTLPTSENYIWDLVINGLNRPVGITHAGDNSNRLFILEQAGVIRILEADTLRTAPFLDIRERVGSSGNEQGLLGLAFHPDFPENGFLYVNYTDLEGDTIIAKFIADVHNPMENQTADPTSEIILLKVEQPFSNHNGGDLRFGPDGMLWIGLGDGGSAGDPQGNGQSLQTLLGKLLRVNVDTGTLYEIPVDNPYSSGGGLPEIWAYGLRNPWRFSFDSLTGDLYIGDVGQNQWEEIHFLPAGYTGADINFGWNLREGFHQYQNRSVREGMTLIEPVFEYSHDLGCSVTGGEVYRGPANPDFTGVYIFGDFCNGNVWGLIQPEPGRWEGQILFDTNFNISSFGLDEMGEVYLVDLNGEIYRLGQK